MKWAQSHVTIFSAPATPSAGIDNSSASSKRDSRPSREGSILRRAFTRWGALPDAALSCSISRNRQRAKPGFQPFLDAGGELPHHFALPHHRGIVRGEGAFSLCVCVFDHPRFSLLLGAVWLTRVESICRYSRMVHSCRVTFWSRDGYLTYLRVGWIKRKSSKRGKMN